MDYIISLAHFCEVHGPTSILCTQLAPVSCHTCYPATTPPSEDLSKDSSYSSGFWESSPTSSQPPQQPFLYSPFTSPPTSPRSSTTSFNPYFASAVPSRERVHRYSNTSEDFDTCDNCSFLVPKDVRERLPHGAPGSMLQDGEGRNGSPILRTTQRILAHGRPTNIDSACSTSSSSSEDDDTPASSCKTQSTHYKSSLSASPAAHTSIRGSPSGPLYIPKHHHRHDRSRQNHHRQTLSNTHTHNLIYISTRQPTTSTGYSLLRRACIRTLSCESLPRGSPSGSLTFGDKIAGYTIAYIFRLPDPRARGRRRTYALLCMGPKDSWRMTLAMTHVIKTFEGIAGQILGMAERALEREFGGLGTSGLSTRLGSPSTRSLNRVGSAATTPPPSSTTAGNTQGRGQGQQSSSTPEEKVSTTTAITTSTIPSPTSVATTTSTQTTTSPTPSTRASLTQAADVSSFLSAKKVDPDGYPRASRDVMRAKGLAEIVGKEDFWVMLHARFCLVLGGLVRGGG